MRLETRLTKRLGIDHPVLSAPMGFVAGGKLAAAVSHAGGLGLIGGGYGDAEWLEREFAAAGNARVGCGFITWSLAQKPELLARVLEKRPAALMLSFGTPAPFADTIKAAGVPLICQVQSMASAREAIEAGADIIVAQGGEAGGHSGSRAMLPLVCEVADFLSANAPDTLLVAAGGIADGRALAAALMLGADGVLIGSRLVASIEASAPPDFQRAIVAADGDATVKTAAFDIVRKYDWPGDFLARGLKNRFVEKWHGHENRLREAATLDAENKRYWDAFHAGDVENTGVLTGEASGMIHAISPAGQIVEDMVAQAHRLLRDSPRLVV